MNNYKLPLCIFSVDPATGKSGWALLEVISLIPLTVHVLKRGEFDGQKLLRQRKEKSKYIEKQYCILDALYDEYVDLLTEFQPDIVVSESAFGYKHMSALISLTLAIHTLRRASITVLNKDLQTVPPTISKRAFADHGGADKELMMKAYLGHIWLTDECDNELTEHQVDAVAHGIGYVKRDITGEVIQISAADKRRTRLEKKKLKEEKERRA